MELSYGNRKDQYEKTRLLLCARFLRVKFPSLHHTLLLPLQDQEKGSLRGSKGPCTHSSPLAAQSRGHGVSAGCCCRRVGFKASAKGPSGFRQPLGCAMHKPPPTSPHYTEVMSSRLVTACQCTSDSKIEVAMARAGPSKSHLKWDLT